MSNIEAKLHHSIFGVQCSILIKATSYYICICHHPPLPSAPLPKQTFPPSSGYTTMSSSPPPPYTVSSPTPCKCGRRGSTSGDQQASRLLWPRQPVAPSPGSPL